MARHRDDTDDEFYELHAPDGRVIRLPPNFSESRLTAAVRDLGWRAPPSAGGAPPSHAASPLRRSLIKGRVRAALPTGRAFDHVLIIVFENQYRSYVMDNAYMRRLAAQGIDMTRYFGVMHPSQPNYIATIAGELCGVTDDELVEPLLTPRTLVDLIEESPAGLRWKAYMESYVEQAQPWSETLSPADHDPYYVKHNPFASFASVVRSRSRWARIESEAALFSDLLNGTFPELAWFSPNIWNDGHYADGTSEELQPRSRLVAQAARWLEGFFARLRFPGAQRCDPMRDQMYDQLRDQMYDRLRDRSATDRRPSHLPPRTLVVVTFDEADFEAPETRSTTYDGPNQIYTVLLGDMIEPGTETEGYNHYSLLRTIEVNFGLGSLHKNDEGANYFQFLWGRRFGWGAPEPTPITRARSVAAQSFAGALFVVDVAPDGEVGVRTMTGRDWSPPQPLGIRARSVALASTRDALVLIYEDERRHLHAARYGEQTGWIHEPRPVVDQPVESFTVASFRPDPALVHQGFPVVDANREIMLVYQVAGGTLASKRWLAAASPSLAPTVSLAPTASCGPMTLGTLGPSLYLIYPEDPAGHRLEVLTYNTAAFNAVDSRYTVDAWSASSFPVSMFSTVKHRHQAPQPSLRPYLAGAPVASATLQGVLHLVHPGAHNPALLTETLSIAGLLTPAGRLEGGPDNQGYGTLEEAGWGPQEPLYGASCPPDGAMTLAAADEALVLLFQRTRHGPVELCAGRYRADEPRP